MPKAILKFLTVESRHQWKSMVYDHYDVIVKHHTCPNGNHDFIEFHFICKVDPWGHNAHIHKRMQTGHSTSNLARGLHECNLRCGVDNKTTGAQTQQTIERSISEYTSARHRALITLCCAVSKWPFNMVKDSLYAQEVALLRPETVLPSPSTISHDVNQIYVDSSNHVKDYFSVCPIFNNAYLLNQNPIDD